MSYFIATGSTCEEHSHLYVHVQKDGPHPCHAVWLLRKPMFAHECTSKAERSYTTPFHLQIVSEVKESLFCRLGTQNSLRYITPSPFPSTENGMLGCEKPDRQGSKTPPCLYP